MPRDAMGGIIGTVVGMFSPLAGFARDLQETLQLDRSLWCRREHGRLEIVMRGGGLTDAPLADRVALARRITDAARPLLADHRKREIRRLAGRAISVAFEDELIVNEGVATSRFSYLASHDHDERELDSDLRDSRRHHRDEDEDRSWL
ncbi:MAG: hypothetical protein ABI035_11810 [Gemmatimonadaceae bacterium]